jgi:hypothetical protein
MLAPSAAAHGSSYRRPKSRAAASYSNMGSDEQLTGVQWHMHLLDFPGYDGGCSGSGGGGGTGSNNGGGSGGGYGAGGPYPGGHEHRSWLVLGCKPEQSSFAGVVWQLVSVVCMVQTLGFLLYGDYAHEAWHDDCFDTRDI